MTYCSTVDLLFCFLVHISWIVNPQIFCFWLYLQIVGALCYSSASNRIISAKDHAAIQINIAEVSDSGSFN